MASEALPVTSLSTEKIKGIHAKASSLCSARLYNKSTFLSSVQVVWFGQPGDRFPFAVDADLNMKTRISFALMKEKFPFKIFRDPPAFTNTCSAFSRHFHFGYCEVRGHNDEQYNVKKTAEYLNTHQWVGVIHISDDSKLYLIPTSTLSQDLGITQPSYPARILHGLFAKKRPRSSESVPRPSQAPTHPPDTITTKPDSKFPLQKSSLENQALPGSGPGLEGTSTRKRRRVTFASEPSSSGDVETPGAGGASDVSPPATSGTETSATVAEALTQGTSQTQQRQTLPPFTLKLEAAAATPGGPDQARPPPWTQQSAPLIKVKEEPLESLRELFAHVEKQSDEESIASSISSATSDVVKPKKRRGGRRPGPRGRRKASGTQKAGEAEVNGTGTRGRKRQYQGRGGRASVGTKVVEEESPDAETIKKRRLSLDIVPFVATKGIARDGANLLYQILDEQTIVIEEVTQELPTEMVSTSPAAQGTQATEEELQVEAGTSQRRNIEAEGGHLTSPHLQNIKLAKDPSVLAVSTAPAVAMQQEEQQQLRQEQELQEEPLPPPSQQQQQQQQVQVQQQVQQQQQQQQVQQQVQQQQQVQGLKQQQEEQQQLLAQQQQQQALKQQQEIQLQTQQQQALKQQQLQAQQQALKQQEQLQTQQQALKQQQQQLQTQQQALKQQQQLQTQQQQQALKQQQLQTQQQALKQQQQLLQTQQHQALQEQQQQLQTQQQQQAQKQQQQPQGHKQQQQLPKQIQQQQLQGQPLKQQPNLQQQKQQPPPHEQPKKETTSSDMAAPIPTNTDGYERSAAADAVRRRLVSESSEIEEEVISLPTQSTEMSVEVTTEVPDAPSESSRAPHVQGVPRKVSLAEYKARRRSTIEDIRPRRDSGGTEPEVAETQKSASQLAERVDGSGGKSIPVADGQTKMKPSPVKLSPLLKGTETRQLTGADSSPKDSLSAARQSVSVKPAPDRSTDPRAAAALGKGTPTTPAPKSGRELPAPSLPKSLVSLASSKLTDDSHAGGAASEKPKPKDASPEPPKITAPITLTSWPSTTPPPPTSSFHSSSSSSPSVSRALFSSIPVHRSVPLKDSPPRPRFHLPPPHPPLPPLHPPPPPHGPFFPPHPGFPHPQAPPPAGHPPFYTPPHPHRIPPPTPWGAYNYFTSQHGGFPYLQAGLVDYSSRSSQDDASPRPPRSPDSPPRSPSRSPSPSGSSSRSFHSGTPTGENSPIDEERDLMQPRIMQFSAGDSKGSVGGGGGGVALDSVNSEPVIHGNHRDYGIQASRDTASQVVQVGHGFKFRSIRTQTARPAATESTGIQCCPKTYNVRIQAEPIPLLSSFSQTPKVHLKNTATQTREPKKPPVADVPEEEQQEKKTTKEEKTSALESLQNLILGMEAPRIDSVLKKVRDFLSAQLDDMVDQHESGRGDAATPRGSNSDYDPVDMSCDDDLTGNEDDVFEADSQPQPGDNVPSPVISGASNISEGDLSELFSGTPSPSTSKGAMSEPYSPTHPLDPDENYSLNDCSKFTNSAGVSDGKGKKSLEEPTMVITGDGVGTTVASSSQEPLKLPTKPSSKQSTALSPPLPAPTGEDRIPDPKMPSGETKPVVRLLVIPHHRLQQQQRPNELSPVPEMVTDRGESAPLHPDSRVDVQRGPPSAPLPAHPPVIPCTFAGTCSSPWELPPRSLPSGAGLQLEPTLSPVLPEPSLLPSKPKQECSPQKTQLGIGPSPALRPSDDDAGDEVWYVRAFSLPPIKLGGPKSSTRSTPSTPSPSSPEKTLGLIAGRTKSDSSAVQSHPSPRRAISNSPPCPRKSSGMIPAKKRPPLTAAELLAKVRAKKTPPPPQQPQRQQPRETHCGGNGLLSTIEERHTEEEVTPPPAIEGDYSGRNGTKTGPIDMNQLMQNFHRHMAARNVLDTSWIKNYRAFCPPPPPPPPPAYSSLPQVPIVFPFAMYQRMPMAAASLPSPPHWVDGCKTGASAQISQTEEDRTPPLGSPSAPADLHHGSKSSTPTLDEDRMSVDLQQEMQGALVGLALAAERHLLQQPVEQVSVADEQAGRNGGSTQETGEPSTAGAVEVAEKCSKVGGESTIVRLPFPAPLDGSPPLLPEERPGDSHVFRTASSSQVAEDSDDRPGTATEMELGPDLVCGVDKTSPRPPLQPDPVPEDDLLDSPHSTPSPPEVLRSAGSPTASLERVQDSPGTPYFSLPNSPAMEATETPTSSLWFTPQQKQVAECLPSQKTDQPRARRSTLVPMTPLFDWKELEEVPKKVLPQSSGGGGMLGPGPTSPPSFLSDGSMEYMEQQERGTIAHELSEVKDDVSELPQLSPSTEEEAAEMIVREQPLMAPDICDEQRGEDPPQVELSRMESESESTSNTCREGGGEGSDETPTLCSKSRSGSRCGHDSIRSSGTPACEPVMRDSAEDVKPEKVAVEQSRGHGSGESATTGRFEAGTWEPTAAISQVEGTAAEGCMDAPLSSVENKLWEHSTTATPVPQKEYHLGTAGDEAVSEQESEGGLRHYDLVPSKVLENISQEALPESVPLPMEDSPMELEQYCSSSPSPSRPESVLSMQEGDEPADGHDVGRSDVPRAGQEPCSSAGRHRERSDPETALGVFPPLEEPARVASDADSASARTSVPESAEGGTTEDGQLGVEGVRHLEQPSEAEVLAVSSQASVGVEGCAAETTTMGALDSLDADCKVRMDCEADVHVPDVNSADAAMPSADTSVSGEGEFTSVIVEEESQLTSSSAEPLGPENQGSVDLEIGNQNTESEEHATHSETTTASLPSSRTGTISSSQPPGAISPPGPRCSLSPATTRSGGNCPSPPQATPTSSIPTPTPGLGEFGTHHEAKDRCRLSSARLNQSSNNSLVLPGNDPCQPILSESSAPDDSSTQVDGERLVSSRRDEVQQECWEETDSDGRVPPDVEELPSRRETSEAQEVEDHHGRADEGLIETGSPFVNEECSIWEVETPRLTVAVDTVPSTDMDIEGTAPIYQPPERVQSGDRSRDQSGDHVNPSDEFSVPEKCSNSKELSTTVAPVRQRHPEKETMSSPVNEANATLPHHQVLSREGLVVGKNSKRPAVIVQSCDTVEYSDAERSDGVAHSPSRGTDNTRVSRGDTAVQIDGSPSSLEKKLDSQAISSSGRKLADLSECLVGEQRKGDHEGSNDTLRTSPLMEEDVQTTDAGSVPVSSEHSESFLEEGEILDSDDEVQCDSPEPPGLESQGVIDLTANTPLRAASAGEGRAVVLSKTPARGSHVVDLTASTPRTQVPSAEICRQLLRYDQVPPVDNSPLLYSSSSSLRPIPAPCTVFSPVSPYLADPLKERIAAGTSSSLEMSQSERQLVRFGIEDDHRSGSNPDSLATSEKCASRLSQDVLTVDMEIDSSTAPPLPTSPLPLFQENERSFPPPLPSSPPPSSQNGGALPPSTPPPTSAPVDHISPIALATKAITEPSTFSMQAPLASRNLLPLFPPQGAPPKPQPLFPTTPSPLEPSVPLNETFSKESATSSSTYCPPQLAPDEFHQLPLQPLFPKNERTRAGAETSVLHPQQPSRFAPPERSQQSFAGHSFRTPQTREDGRDGGSHSLSPLLPRRPPLLQPTDTCHSPLTHHCFSENFAALSPLNHPPPLMHRRSPPVTNHPWGPPPYGSSAPHRYGSPGPPPLELEPHPYRQPSRPPPARRWSFPSHNQDSFHDHDRSVPFRRLIYRYF